MASFVFTVLGPDRPGLVDELAGVVEDHGGNWERSRMAHLAGRFAGIVEVTVPERRASELRAALDALSGSSGLHVTVDLGGDDPAAATTGRRITIGVVGTDRPGLVHAVASALAGSGANIEELVTATTSAPMAGGMLFEATATVALPDGVAVDDVRARLEALADRLMVDIELSD